jgi:hypothetical protein
VNIILSLVLAYIPLLNLTSPSSLSRSLPLSLHHMSRQSSRVAAAAPAPAPRERRASRAPDGAGASSSSSSSAAASSSSSSSGRGRGRQAAAAEIAPAAAPGRGVPMEADTSVFPFASYSGISRRLPLPVEPAPLAVSTKDEAKFERLTEDARRACVSVVARLLLFKATKNEPVSRTKLIDALKKSFPDQNYATHVSAALRGAQVLLCLSTYFSYLLLFILFLFIFY